jgi:hypothetical protein
MPVWCGAKDLDLRTPASVEEVVVKRRVEVVVVGCWSRHCWRRRVVRGVVERVVVRDRSSRCCIGVCGGMVDVCGVWMCRK